MPTPKFTDDEKYLINSLMHDHGTSNGYSLFIVLFAILMVVAGLFQDSIGMIFAAFCLACGYQVYQITETNKWTPVYQSMIRKYEAALAGDDDESNPAASR